MPFVKLDTGITDSSLWREPATTCKCWITLLAMANASGLVESTAPGISQRAHITLKQTQAALATFEAPDAHSRSLNDEGRRIERVDGGYQIINFRKYRDSEMRRLKRREYHRQYWHSRKLKETQTHSNGLKLTQQDSTNPPSILNTTEAEAEADKEKKRRADEPRLPVIQLKSPLSERFDEWMKFRRGMGKKVKDWNLLFERQKAWLLKFSTEVACEIVDQSIRNGWQGLFEPKANGQRNGQRQMSAFEIKERIGAINAQINKTFKENGSKRIDGDGITELKQRREELHKQLFS